MENKDKYKDNGDILKEFQDKLEKARAGRAQYESELDFCDRQYEAEVSYGSKGLKVNVPVEKNLVETYVGKFAGKVVFDIVPVGQADADELQPAKYILESFLDDDNQKYNFYTEKRKFMFDKGKYGTGIFYTGITYDSEMMPEIPTEDSFFSNDFKMKKVDKRCFSPRHIPIRNIFFDPDCLKQSDINRMKYCIIKEKVKPSVLQERYKGVKNFSNLENVRPDIDSSPEYIGTAVEDNEATIYYYYNQETKDYWIIANEEEVLYKGKYFYRNGKLPITVVQHYTRTNCMYGEGIPHRIRSMKGYKNTALQSMLDKMVLSSGYNLGIGGNGMVDGELYTESGEISLWKFGNNIDQVKQFNFDGNSNVEMSILELLENYITQDSGIDVRASYTTQAGTLGQQEIMEEQKQIRSAGVDESYQIGLDGALSDTYWNIRFYSPSLLIKKEKDKDGNVIKEEYPMIKVPNQKIKKKKGKLQFVEDMGKYGWFELNEKVLKHIMSVKITTPSTKMSLKALEREKANDYINQMAILSKINPEMVQKYFNMEQIVGWLNNIMGIDNDKLVTMTKKDAIRKKNEELIKKAAQSVGVNQPGNAEEIQAGQELSANAPGPDNSNKGFDEMEAEVEAGMGMGMGGGEQRSIKQEGSDLSNGVLGNINV